MNQQRPRTLAECFQWLDANLSPEQIDELRQLARDELWQTHKIDKLVAEKLLKDNTDLQQMLDGAAFCADPDIASQIVTAYWDHLQIRG